MPSLGWEDGEQILASGKGQEPGPRKAECEHVCMWERKGCAPRL